LVLSARRLEWTGGLSHDGRKEEGIQRSENGQAVSDTEILWPNKAREAWNMKLISVCLMTVILCCPLRLEDRTCCRCEKSLSKRAIFSPKKPSKGEFKYKLFQ
jgi:hypothetical protein